MSYLIEALRHGRKPNGKSEDPEERKLYRNLCGYTHKGSDTYDHVFDKKIRKLRQDWFNNHREELLELVRSGAKRPSRTSKDPKERQLARSLSRYTYKSTYSPAFGEMIRELRPDWFISTADIKKKKLLKLAKSGAKRPIRGSLLGNALGNYTHSISSYDPAFSKEIRNLRPDWFENTTIKKKEKLFELARSGAKKPSRRSKDPKERKLCSALFCYAYKNNNAYDPIFDKKIRNLRPDWFENTTIKKKEKLFELARSGAKRPGQTPLGGSLWGYTNKNSAYYDPIFDREIRELRPDWFRKTSAIKKEELLELARSGAKRPNKREFYNGRKLGSALACYTSKNRVVYDPAFDKKIRELRPDWFRSRKHK